MGHSHSEISPVTKKKFFFSCTKIDGLLHKFVDLVWEDASDTSVKFLLKMRVSPTVFG